MDWTPHLEPGKRVTVWMRGGQRFRGEVLAVAEEAVTLRCEHGGGFWPMAGRPATPMPVLLAEVVGVQEG